MVAFLFCSLLQCIFFCCQLPEHKQFNEASKVEVGYIERFKQLLLCIILVLLSQKLA